MLKIQFYLLTASNNSKSALSNCNEVADKICRSCSTDVALAIGLPMLGWADNQAKATGAGAVLCFSATLSKAFRIFSPCSFRYLAAPCPRGLLLTSFSERYFPLTYHAVYE